MTPISNKHLANIISLGFLGILLIAFLLAKLPLEPLILYGAMSVLAVIFYSWDKYAAKKGNKRIRESTLHLTSLLFGWPGAALAQQWLRHKTVKVKFRRVFWLTAVINTSFFYWLYNQQQEKWFIYLKSMFVSLDIYSL